jgi:protein phosphatase
MVQVIDHLLRRLRQPEIPTLDAETDEDLTPIDMQRVGLRLIEPVQYGIITDSGGRRKNEDAAAALVFDPLMGGYSPELGLFVVADGMGGRPGGADASAIAVRTVVQTTMSMLVWPYLNCDLTMTRTPDIREVIRDSIILANRAVGREVPVGGTTLTCALIRGSTAFIGHVGDTRAYLITDKTITQLTDDQSMVGLLAKSGQITSEQAANHPQRHVILQALGLAEDLDTDTLIQYLPAGSQLLICSDGLWGVVDEDTIHTTVLAHSVPQEACNMLLEMAVKNNTPDNVTVVIARMPGRAENRRDLHET